MHQSFATSSRCHRSAPTQCSYVSDLSHLIGPNVHLSVSNRRSLNGTDRGVSVPAWLWGPTGLARANGTAGPAGPCAPAGAVGPAGPRSPATPTGPLNSVTYPN